MTPDGDRFLILCEMFKSAIEKANSFEPIDIAYALEGMEGTSVDGGKIYMRKKRIIKFIFDNQALLVTEKDKQSII